MLIDFTRRSVRVDPTERPGRLVLRAASSHDFNAQLVCGEHDDVARMDGGLIPDEEWEEDRPTTFERFREWALWQGVFEDQTSGGEFTFTLESAYLADGKDAYRVVQVTLNPICISEGWEIELKCILDEPVSLSVICEDFDQMLRPEALEDEEDVDPAPVIDCFDRLFQD